MAVRTYEVVMTVLSVSLRW